MSLTVTQLFDHLDAGGFRPVCLESGVGRLIISEYGGRIMGVFPDFELPNLLWTPPALATPDGAATLRASGNWQLGGERLWLAPELELHFTDPAKPSAETYQVPGAIDPGDWTLEREDGGAWIRLVNSGRVVNQLTKTEFGFRIERDICGSKPGVCGMDFDSYGYEIETRLRIDVTNQPDTAYGLWNVAMVPVGGTMLIPLRQAPQLVDYYQNDVVGRCTQSSDYVAFPISGSNWHKLGLRANDVRGAFGYWRPLPDDQATLIIRQTPIDRDGVYIDYPGHTPECRDVVFQFYDDNGAQGAFGEFESHAPAATAETGFYASDKHDTWYFTGSRESLKSVAAELLGISREALSGG